MPLRAHDAQAALARLAQFSAVLDARTPAEFALDHLPGAHNWPVLSDAERVEVGTLYRQAGSHTAKLLGARYVSRNIATLLEQHATLLAQATRGWTCLVYCWRGGKRSGALAHVLAEIGVDVTLLRGGYKAFRREVSTQWDMLACGLRWRVVCGETGSGKSRLLRALQAAGAQVLDLEQLANHRGSVLGLTPGEAQPSQKHFETRIWDQLRSLDATRPVWVESESKKVGALQVPEALMTAMRAAPCIHLDLHESLRVRLLMQEYQHFTADEASRATLHTRLSALRPLRGSETVEHWQTLALSQDWEALVRELLREHYDPIYRQSMMRHYQGLSQAVHYVLEDISPAAFAALATRLHTQTANHA